MPQADGTDEGTDEPFTTLFGQEGQERLIFAKTEDWLEDKSVQIACHEGYVDLQDMR